MIGWIAIVDLVPTILFLGASLFLREKFFSLMTRCQFSYLWCGCIIVVIAGMLKAAYKILYYFEIAKIQILSDVFFVLQAIGFAFIAIGLVTYVALKKEPNYKHQFKGRNVIKTVSVLILVTILCAFAAFLYEIFTNNIFEDSVGEYSIKMIFICIMIFGLLVSYICLLIICLQEKHTLTAILFAIAIVFSLAMGFLSRLDFGSSFMNLIAEFVNITGQLIFFIACYRLYKYK